MSLETKSIAQRFFQEQDRLRGGPAPELCAPTYTAQISGNPAMDLAGHTEFAAMFYAAFPDTKHHILEAISEGNRAAVRLRITGTNDGSFMGMPATGRPIDITATVLVTVLDGKVTVLNAEFDQAGLMQQISTVPVS